MERNIPNKKILAVMIMIFLLLFSYVAYAIIQNNKNKNMQDTTQNATSTNLRAAVARDIIVIDYSGKLENGTEFDSSYKRGQPFVFQLGIGQVIKGWDEGLIGAKKGDKKTLTIPGEKAYGNQEIKGPDGKVLIPKNATLIFDVEVIDVISEEDAIRMMQAQQAAQGGTSTKR